MTPGQKLQQAFADTQATGWVDPLRWDDFDKAAQQRYEAAARRFLEIIREPTPGMIAVASAIPGDSKFSDAYRAMVDALLQETPDAAD